MRTALVIALLALSFIEGKSQEYTPSQIFAHNDYVRAKPFYTAYELGVGYIEADVYLIDGKLLVAHQRREIDARILAGSTNQSNRAAKPGPRSSYSR